MANKDCRVVDLLLN